MTSKGFTKINNSILDNKSISFDSKGVYMTLARYCSIPEFKINKTHIKSVTGLGEIRFNKAWKELKEKNILIQDKKSVNGRFEYVYTLKNNEVSTAKVVAPAEKKKPTVPPKSPKRIDSDGNPLMDGQVTIEEAIEAVKQQELSIGENIAEVTEVTGFATTEVVELLKIANNDVAKVVEAHKYTLVQSKVKDVFNYTKWAIKNNKVLKSKVDDTRDIFNDYPQRVYEFDKLENAFLYGEPYELPA